MKKRDTVTRVSLPEARRRRGRSRLHKLLADQRKELGQSGVGEKGVSN